MNIEAIIAEQAALQQLPAREIRYQLREQLNASLGIKKRATEKVFSDSERKSIREWADSDWTITAIASTLDKSVNQVRGVLLQLDIRGLRF